MARQAYSFRVAYQTEEELSKLTDSTKVDPYSLEFKILPNGLPSYKTIHASGETEQDAVRKAEAYVSKTSYRDIVDGKVV